MNKKLRLLGVLSVAAAMALTGCAEDTNSAGAPNPGGDSAPSGDSIVIGSINSLSGIATFPESSQAAKAVFDEFNAAGGLNGKKIDYVITDDKVDPSAAVQAARDIVDSKHAVAMVGGASLIECEINAAYYKQKGIVSVPGLGIDPGCFNSPDIASVTQGPYRDTQASLTYGSEVLGLNKICGFLATAGSAGPAYKAVLDEWTAETGKKLAYMDDTVPNGNPDFTPQAVKAKEMGCDGIFVNMPENDDLGFLKAAQAQGLTNITWLLLPSAYTEQFAAAAGDAVGNGVYQPAELAPYTDTDDPANKDWVDLMNKNNIPLTAFAQAGYVAAHNFLDVLTTIKGDVTRESVAAALRSMEPIDNPMAGGPWVFGPGDKHDTAMPSFPMTIKDGKWVKAADDWFSVNS